MNKMRNLIYNLGLSICFSIATISFSFGQCGDAYIGGLMDGYQGSSYPKFILICANADIRDLSTYSVESANNGNGSTNPTEFQFPAVELDAGDCLTIESGSGVNQFIDYFGCGPDYTDGAANINGDDAILLYCDSGGGPVLEDVYGDPNVDGTGEAWEYTDGWAARLNASAAPSITFDPSDWAIAPNQTLTMHPFNDNAMQTVECPPCTDFTYDAKAFCYDDNNDFVEGSYYVTVDNISGGYSSGIYEVAIGATSQTYSGTELVFGPYTHSGSGNAVQSVTINETTGACNVTFEVVETLCTDIDGNIGGDTAPDNNMALCDCSDTNNLDDDGVIIAQSEPGTFSAGGTSGAVQIYLLLDGNSGSVNKVSQNATGLFSKLASGTYYVYALNYETSNAADVISDIAGSTIDIDALVNAAAPYDDECYKVCGPANYTLDCGSSNVTLACNDHLNITVSESCDINVSADVFLEGEQYAEGRYSIEITTADGTVVDFEELTASTDDDVHNFLGQDLIFTVTEACSDNSCWGNVTLEDKSIPTLDCQDVTVLCTELDNLDPGAMIKGWDRALAEGVAIPAGSNVNIPLVLDEVAGVVTDVIVNFEALTTNVSELNVCLTSPNGQTTLDLIDHSIFTSDSRCDNSNINVCISDEASNAHSMLASPALCVSTRNALFGSFRPLDALSGFNGDDAGGSWTLVVKNTGSSTATVVQADLQVATDEGDLLTNTDIITNSGCTEMPEFRFTDVESDQTCVNDLWKTITRTWTVTNPESGQSASCNQTINVRRYKVEDIIWPKNFDDIDQPSLVCDGNNDTGMPQLACDTPIGGCGNFAMSGPTVIDFPICGNSYKRINTWTILDWCTGDLVEYDQVIKVVDNNPIIVTCVPDNLPQQAYDQIGYDPTSGGDGAFVGALDEATCTGSWRIVPPLVIDNPCGDATTMQVFYLPDDDTDASTAPTDGQYIEWTGGDVLDGLPVDRRTWIRIVITDECGNTGECFTEVDILDDTSPICIAKEFIVVGLSDPGTGPDGVYGKLSASSVDNGSYDCSPLTFEIRRISSPCNNEDLSFGENVKFCCDDLGVDGLGEVQVELRATDSQGNSCTVISTVRLKNSVPVTVECPDGFIVDCEADYNTVDAFPSITGLCGEEDITFDSNAVIASTTPASKPASTSPLYDIDGDGQFDQVPPFDERCQFGAVRRSFVGSDGRTWCEQYIVIEPAVQLNPNSIVWPSDITVDCSDYTPNQPQFNSHACLSIGVTVESDTFWRVDNSCYKVRNEWTVIDWCLFDQTNGAEGRYSSEQLITVHDFSAPTINPTQGLSFETASDNCRMGSLTVSAVANDSDNCPEAELDWTIFIDYNDDNVVDETLNRTTHSGDSIFITLSNVPVNKSGHSISWQVMDQCENLSTSESRFTVADVKAPTPYCVNVSTATMSDGTVEIWAKDMNANSSDNCTSASDLIFTFSEQIPPASGYYNPTTGANAGITDYQEGTADIFDPSENTSGRVISRNDIDENGQVQLDVYVWDECRNFDFCAVTLTVQDDSTSAAMVVIEGDIRTEFGEAVQDVKSELMDLDSGQPDYYLTDEAGEYAFNDVPMSRSYEVSNSKNDDYLNGVSTLDIVLIQRHILGSNRLDSPYKMIAADINSDENITAIDLIELRKLILGIYDELPESGSWKFVDAGQELSIQNPWIYREYIDHISINRSYLNDDFIGVKIGDVNNSMIPNVVSQGSELRSGATVQLLFEDKYVKEGEMFEIEFSADHEDLFGYQFTMITEGVQILEVTGRDMSDYNYNIFNGGVVVSQNSDYSIHPGQGFLSVHGIAESNGWISEMIRTNSSVARAEAYLGKDLTISGIRLAPRSEDAFRLFQNEPNPFANQTSIGFEVPFSTEVKFTLYDISGKLIKSFRIDANQGYNSLVLSSDDLEGNGLVYYKMESGQFSETKRMIMLD